MAYHAECLKGRAQKEAAKGGKCRFCGCTWDDACVLDRRGIAMLITCAWADSTRTLCTNPKCLEKAKAA